MIQEHKVLFVDWNRTLSNSLFWGHLQVNKPEDFAKIERWLFKKNPQIINLWMRGEEDVKSILSAMEQDTSLPENYLLNELEKSCKSMEFIFHECLEIISLIRSKGIKVVLATDNMDVFNQYTVPALNLQNHFDDILSSFSLKCLKTDEDEKGNLKFFEVWLFENRIPIKNAALIDDSVKHKEFFEAKGLSFLPVNDDLSVLDHLKKYAY